MEKTEGAVNNGQSRDTGNIENTRRRKNKNNTQKHKAENSNKIVTITELVFYAYYYCIISAVTSIMCKVRYHIYGNPL